jgi:hypothetical protein
MLRTMKLESSFKTRLGLGLGLGLGLVLGLELSVDGPLREPFFMFT